MKQIKKIYKKAPKKKLATQAATYGLKTLIGGPYLDLLAGIYKGSKKKIIKYGGQYAYHSLLTSQYAKEKLSIIPMALTSTIVRLLFNFLLLSNIQTGIYWLDFIISVLVTVIVSLASPIFYKSIQAHESTFIHYSEMLINSHLSGNKNDNIYLYTIIIGGSMAILLLFMVDISSGYLQYLIFHGMIAGTIVDRLNLYINNNKVKPVYYGMGPTDPISAHVLGPHNYHIQKFKKVKLCHTDNIIIMNKPLTSSAAYL